MRACEEPLTLALSREYRSEGSGAGNRMRGRVVVGTGAFACRGP